MRESSEHIFHRRIAVMWAIVSVSNCWCYFFGKPVESCWILASKNLNKKLCFYISEYKRLNIGKNNLCLEYQCFTLPIFFLKAKEAAPFHFDIQWPANQMVKAELDWFSLLMFSRSVFIMINISPSWFSSIVVLVCTVCTAIAPLLEI